MQARQCLEITANQAAKRPSRQAHEDEKVEARRQVVEVVGEAAPPGAYGVVYNFVDADVGVAEGEGLEFGETG